MDALDYLTKSRLTASAGETREAQQALWAVLDEAKKRSLPATPSALDRLYISVGTASNEGSGQPFDLGKALGGRSMETSFVLMTLDGLAEFAHRQSKLKWLRLYQLREGVLVRLVYRGGLSRAQLALSEPEPIATAARDGLASIIEGQVLLPVFDEDGAVVAALDAGVSEASNDVLARLAALAIEVASHLPD